MVKYKDSLIVDDDRFYRRHKLMRKLRIVINVILILIVLAVWVSLFFITEEGMLESPGITSLKYYTVLSNLFYMVASVIWLIKPCDATERLKYSSVVALMVTFSVVLFFLGPLYGFIALFSGTNLWYHLIVPLAGTAEFVVFERMPVKIKDNLWATSSVFVYGTFYMLNNLINGTGVYPNTNDWYGFLLWGWPVGIVIFIGIAGLAFGMGLLIRGLIKLRVKVMKNE